MMFEVESLERLLNLPEEIIKKSGVVQKLY